MPRDGSSVVEPMKHRALNNATFLQVLHDYSLEKLRGYAVIPDAIRVHDDDRPSGAHAEARRLPAFHPRWAEQ